MKQKENKKANKEPAIFEDSDEFKLTDLDRTILYTLPFLIMGLFLFCILKILLS